MSYEDDNRELNELLANESSGTSNRIYSRSISDDPESCVGESKEKPQTYIQWTQNGDYYFPAGKTVDCLKPGVYEIKSVSGQIFFERIPVKTEGLLIFPDTVSESICEEIEKFWDRAHLFKKYKLPHKRGMLLWGPAGSGKSCTIQLVMADVIARGGVVFQFCHPSLFIEGMRTFRKIQPDTPLVVTMEDIDSLIDHCESEVLNILDGITQVEKVVFLATTNYVNLLGARIVNRPSRFDKRFKIDFPNPHARRVYLEYIIGKDNLKEYNIDIDRWVRDTSGFSLAHLKELFVAVVILGDKYEMAIETLSSMKEKIDDRDYDNQMGFSTKKDIKQIIGKNGCRR